jgi:alkylation response protein AidB-like acyl-CoA dehydrogenase
MVELDWPLLAVPESAGGVGCGFVEMAVVAEELGRAIAPSPFEAVATQYQPLLLALGESWTGGAVGTLAVAESGGWWPTRDVTNAVRRGDDWTVTGVKRWVFDASGADEILVVAETELGRGVFRVAREAAGVGVAPLRSLDPTRRLASVSFDDAPARLVGAGPGPDVEYAVAAVLDQATAVIALETVGTCQALFDMALEYAKSREQFGVPIGSFQAIKHKLADMFVALERARATAYFAAVAIAEDDNRRPLAVSMAKAAVGDAQRLIAQESIQIHGGIGYTWEHDVHMFVKRAKGGDALFGTAAEHRERITWLLTEVRS